MTQNKILVTGGAGYIGSHVVRMLTDTGKPVVVLAQIFQHSPAVLITLRESGIFSAHELVGKRVMLPTDDIGTAPIQAMLQKTIEGTDQVSVLPHSDDDGNLINGKVDAIAGSLSNDLFRLRQKGLAVNIISPHSYP